MKHLLHSDFVSMPWRNGGGITHEIAAERDEDALLWRISTARVEADGPYSLFTGLTRLSAVVGGNGVQLHDVENGELTTVRPGDIAELSGDRLYQGTLIDGGISHLNTIFNADRVDVAVSHIRNCTTELTENILHFLYCVDGVIEHEGEIVLPGDVLQADPGSLNLDAKSEAVWIAITSRP